MLGAGVGSSTGGHLVTPSCYDEAADSSGCGDAAGCDQNATSHRCAQAPHVCERVQRIYWAHSTLHGVLPLSSMTAADLTTLAMIVATDDVLMIHTRADCTQCSGNASRKMRPIEEAQQSATAPHPVKQRIGTNSNP